MMKCVKLLICLLANWCIITNAQAQENGNAYLEIPTRNKGLQLNFEGGKTNFANTEGDYNYNGGHFYMAMAYKMNPKLSVGGGLGLEFTDFNYQQGIQSLRINHTQGKLEYREGNASESLETFKLFARGQYRFFDGRLSPFVACDLGLRITGGLSDIYTESWLEEEELLERATEDDINNTLAHVLGKPSLINVFASPAVGLQLRIANNSYMELKAGYTLSPYAMGRRKSVEYMYYGSQMTHIAACRAIKMSAPFVSIGFTHTLGAFSDLDESLYEATKKRKRENFCRGLVNAFVITGAVLGTAGAVMGAVNRVNNIDQSGYTGGSSSSSGIKKASTSTGSTTATRKPSASTAIDANLLRKIYSDNHGLLAEMKTWPEKYDESVKRDIQSQMKERRKTLKEKYGETISKSDLEDWSGPGK